MKFFKQILAIGLIVLSTQVFAAAPISPRELVLQTVKELKTSILKQKASLNTSPKALYKVVNTVLIPHIDLNRMAAMTLGPKWRTATEAQKKAFVPEFTQMLTRTYAVALLKVSNYKISLNPMRGNAWKSANMVTVTGTISPLAGGQPSRVTYYLDRTNTSDPWQIYDLAVEGVSFSKTFRSQFQSFPSIAPLITKLTALNKAN